MLRGGGGGHDRRSVFLSSAKALTSNYSVFGEGGSDGTRTKKNIDSCLLRTVLSVANSIWSEEKTKEKRLKDVQNRRKIFALRKKRM